MQVLMLADLLAGNARHVASLADDHFAEVRDSQAPSVVSICCSDSRVSAEGMWSITGPGELFLSETIGNQAWDEVDGELRLSGDVAYPLVALGTRTVVVVGHTGCGAVAAALEAVRDGELPGVPGLRAKVSRLVPVVEAGLEQASIAQAEDPLNLLVELNVHTQVDFLLGCPELPDGTQVLGFVYDLHARYGGPAGRTVLVNVDGERDPKVLLEQVPEQHRGAVASLL